MTDTAEFSSGDSSHHHTVATIEPNFGNSTPYSVGVEEQLQLVRAGGYELVSGIESILASFDGEALAQRVKPQPLQSFCEVATRIGASVDEVVCDLLDLRHRLEHAAADRGWAIVAAGTHPFSRHERQERTDRPRFARLAETYGLPFARQLVFGLHIHVGVNTAAKAIACANGVRNHLPELLALTANSPFWRGKATGLASTRARIVQELPHTGVPPVLPAFADFELLAARGIRTGCFNDYSELWWDVRPHPRLGTVEVRICDAQTRIENVAATAALVQSLVATVGSAFDCDDNPAPRPTLILEENRWRAMRDGLDARLIDQHDRERPAREVIGELTERCTPAAEALGCAEELSFVSDILACGGGADEQRCAYEERGDLVALTRWLAEQTTAHLLSTRPALHEL